MWIISKFIFRRISWYLNPCGLKIYLILWIVGKVFLIFSICLSPACKALAMYILRLVHAHARNMHLSRVGVDVTCVHICQAIRTFALISRHISDETHIFTWMSTVYRRIIAIALKSFIKKCLFYYNLYKHIHIMGFECYMKAFYQIPFRYYG